MITDHEKYVKEMKRYVWDTLQNNPGRGSKPGHLMILVELVKLSDGYTDFFTLFSRPL